MKILVTGTAGFIGMHTAIALINKGHEVIGLDNINDYYDVNLKYARLAETGIYKDEIAWGRLIKSHKYPNYIFIRQNIEDKDFMMELFKMEKFDYVIHLAAQAGVRYSMEAPDIYIQSNVNGFHNVLEACRHYPVEQLIYASSSSVYGNNTKVPFSEDDNVDHPVSLYACTKKCNELMAATYSHLYKIPCIGLRFFTVYGPWARPDMALFLFTDAIINDRPIKVFNNGELSRDFTYIDDIVQGIVAIVDKGRTNNEKLYDIYNIGNGKPEKLLDFIQQIEKALSKEAQKEFMPMQDGDVNMTWANIGKLKNDYGFNAATDISEGIRSFVAWYKSR